MLRRGSAAIVFPRAIGYTEGMKRVLPFFFAILCFAGFQVSSCSHLRGKARAAGHEEDSVLRDYIGGMVLVEGAGGSGSFRIGRYEVTQELYEAVMGTNPSYYSKNPPEGETQGRRPVEFVSWYDAVAFCNRLTVLTMGEKECCYTLSNIQYETDDDEAAKKKAFKEDPTYVTFIRSADVTIRHDKKGFRLPTREEWLFAAKGGTKSRSYRYAGSDDAAEVAWYYDNSGRVTHEVGRLKPNELGLYDMSGNVKEFCEDLSFYTNTKNEVFPRRISSGGSFFAQDKEAYLSEYDEGLEAPGNGGQGFRIVCAAAR